VQDKDILLNPAKGGYFWDILSEFEGNYVSLTKTLIESVDFSEEEKSETEKYFFKMFAHINKIIPEISTPALLNAFVFRPLVDMASDLETVLNLKVEENLQKYSYIREKMSVYLKHLKPTENNVPEISVGNHINDNRYDKSILFVSCHGDRNMLKLAQLIKFHGYCGKALKIFSSKTLTEESANTVIIAAEIGTFGRDCSVISSASEIFKRNNVKKIFSATLQDNKNSFFAKIYGTDKTIAVCDD
jgi:hypothetical protein